MPTCVHGVCDSVCTMYCGGGGGVGLCVWCVSVVWCGVGLWWCVVVSVCESGGGVCRSVVVVVSCQKCLWWWCVVCGGVVCVCGGGGVSVCGGVCVCVGLWWWWWYVCV